MRRAALLFVGLCAFCAVDGGEAFTPLRVDGQGGFWNQVVVGKDQAYPDRIGGLSLLGSKPVASFVDRETPMEFDKRWDLISERSQLNVYRGMSKKMMSLDSTGNAIFGGKMKVDGVLRVKNLALEGVAGAAKDANLAAASLGIGTDLTSNMALGADDKVGWVQSNKGENLVFNPRVSKDDVKHATTFFSEDAPKHTVDVRGDLFVQNSLKLGVNGGTHLKANELKFALGGGWTSTDASWISSLKTKPVQFGGAVFGTRLGVGAEVKNLDWRLQVHNGHFVVSGKVGELLKGLTTYITPAGAHVKAYDYTRKEEQKWRITGTKILLNPDQAEDGRVCIGCENPEHHLQSEGNMYVNGNVFVNKHLHVKGNMHIDKIITPKVFIHSKAETPEYGRGIMIGNDLENKWKTKTNMRIGYTKEYGWLQSHSEVPLVLNGIGGATCIGCEVPAKDIEVHVGGDGYVSGELFVATLKKKVPKKTEEAAAETAASPARRLLTVDDTQDTSLSVAEAKKGLKRELQNEHLDVMSAWASATKIIQDNHARISKRATKILQNEGAIAALERQVAALTSA